jgi:hypothetical protein
MNYRCAAECSGSILHLRKRCEEARVLVDGGGGLAFDVVVEVQVVLEVDLIAIEQKRAGVQLD